MAEIAVSGHIKDPGRSLPLTFNIIFNYSTVRAEYRYNGVYNARTGQVDICFNVLHHNKLCK